MSLNQGKYKPRVCVIDEVDDHRVPPKTNEQLAFQEKATDAGSETMPLTTASKQYNGDKKQSQLTMAGNSDDGSLSKEQQYKSTTKALLAGNGGSGGGGEAEGFDGGGKSAEDGGSTVMGHSRRRLSLDSYIGSTRKQRILYITTAGLCALFLLVIILVFAFWPEVPFYLKADICLEKKCVQASQQVLLWANISTNVCDNPYEWACGKFTQEYEENNYFVIKHGEWNFKTYNEFQELNELNRFISTLQSSGVSYSIEAMIASLYRSCREIDTLDKSQSDLLLKKAIKSVDGWQAFREFSRLQYWEYKKALIHLQGIYGIFPYYKVNVQNRYNKPYDYVISIDEGEIGLPDKHFYNGDQNIEIVRGYKLLLRDFAINMGIVSNEADMFADDVFHYEKRIVNHINSVKIDNSKRKLNEMITLAELKRLAPSLPIFETLQVVFPYTKITEETEVLVCDVEVLQELSTVVSTSDKKPINNFIIWSLARHLLPHLSKEYRNLVQSFDFTIYGRIATYPRWLVCAKVVQDWLPFGLDALQQNSYNILKVQNNKQFNKPFSNITHNNDEFIILIFNAVNKQLRHSITQAKWLDESLKVFINEKLKTMRVQIGLPEEVLLSPNYLKDYYNNLLLNNLFFVDHVEAIWSFRKSQMEKKMKTLNMIDTIISEMYSSSETTKATITYSNILNMMIISHSIVSTQYYDYRYPMSVNFARIGVDILEVLIATISTFAEQFKADHIASMAINGFNVDLSDCIAMDDDLRNSNNDLMENALQSFHITLSASKIAARALSSFIRTIDDEAASSHSIMDSINEPSRIFEKLGLLKRDRLPGLRAFNDNELYTLAYMQKHCSTSVADKDYARVKPYVEKQMAERYLFNATWNHIQFLPRSTNCRVPKIQCSNIL